MTIDFKTYKTENLERISGDGRYKEYHAAIEAVLATREGHLYLKNGMSTLLTLAKEGKTINYKEFYETVVGGEVKWDHTKMGLTASFLTKIVKHCDDLDLPLLSCLVVNKQTGECGDGFFIELVQMGIARSTDDPRKVAAEQRELCWSLT